MRPRPCCACAALITDLKQRGLLDETLVIWGGEFGRTPMNEARGGSTFLGRDHHPAVFSCVLAGAGVRDLAQVEALHRTSSTITSVRTAERGMRQE